MHTREILASETVSVCDATQKRPKKKTNVKVFGEKNTSLQRDKISHKQSFSFLCSLA